VPSTSFWWTPSSWLRPEARVCGVRVRLRSAATALRSRTPALRTISSIEKAITPQGEATVERGSLQLAEGGAERPVLSGSSFIHLRSVSMSWREGCSKSRKALCYSANRLGVTRTNRSLVTGRPISRGNEATVPKPHPLAQNAKGWGNPRAENRWQSQPSHSGSVVSLNSTVNLMLPWPNCGKLGFVGSPGSKVDAVSSGGNNTSEFRKVWSATF